MCLAQGLQRSEAGEAQTPDPSVSSQALYHWATALPFACNWQQPFVNDPAEWRRMTVEIISWSISTQIWDQAGIELTTPGYAVRLTPVVPHVIDCATRPSTEVPE